MITVTNLTKRYASSVALNNISFSIPRGEITGLLGPNGAGKTTIMRILTGYLSATEGTVLIDDLDIFTHSLEIRRRIGYLPENVSLYPEMRVDEFLLFRGKLKGLPRRKCRDRAEEVKTLCGLKEVERRVIGRLSRGYWQRVGLADSLIHGPTLLILDEPTLGLDPNQVRKVRELIKSLGRRYTILLSTHFLSEAEMLCHRVMILNQGKIVAFDSPQHLMGMLKGAIRIVAEIFGPSREVTHRLEGLPQTFHVSCEPCKNQGISDMTAAFWGRYIIECEKSTDMRSKIFDIISHNKWALRELRIEEKRLEDVFVEMTIYRGSGS